MDVQISGVPGDTTPLTASVPVGEWHFLAVTCDDGQDLRCVYVDGQLQAAGTCLESGTPIAKYLCLGVPDKATYWGTVAFARMSVWNHAMSEREVQLLYDRGGDVRIPPVPGGVYVLVR